MNLENVTVEMRPRSEWEAADFGVGMIRRDAAAIYRVWFAITLPLLALALFMTIFTPYHTLAALLYWWLEPIADGPILRIISRRLFGEEADVRATLRATGKLAWRNKIFLITPYRFHFARSIAMPVTQLEGLKGSARKSRAKVLNQKIFNYGAGLTVAYHHLALSLYIGVILVGFALVPTPYQGTVGLSWLGIFGIESTVEASVLSLLIIYLAQSALQPWFVGAGFGIYINCRTQLEAWDIEVAFRRMVLRRAKAIAATVLLGLLVVPAVFPSSTLWAQEAPDSSQEQALTGDPGFHGYWSDDKVQPALETVFEKDELKTSRETSAWQRIPSDKPESEPDDVDLSWWIRLIDNIGGFFSLVIEFGLWIGVAVLLWLLFATRARWLPYLGYYSGSKPAVRKVILASGELTAEELPNDIPAEVVRLWENGEKRKALSLLYRGSVFAAVTQHGVRLPNSATEGSCVSAVDRQTDAEQAKYFRRVVSTWVRCAYGFRDPADDAIGPLCSEWPRHYGGAT